MNLDISEMMLRLPVVLLALTVHEFCHAYFAYRMGDPTAYRQGRLTLNPIAHLDPLGTICLIFAPIGWAKPVPINPLNFRDRKKGILVSTAAGPLSNLVQAILWALILRGTIYASASALISNVPFLKTAVTLCLTGVYVNVGLAVFNCLPLFPLDGFHITYQLGGSQLKQKMQQMVPFSPFIILGLVMVGNMGRPNVLIALILPPAKWILTYVAGY